MIDESFSNSNENNKKNTDHEIIDKTGVDPIDETEEVSPIEQTEEGLSKECPICAETVQAKAKICRFCTHEFETEEVSPIEQTEEGLLIKCPHCAEYIKKEAIKCKHCGERLKISENQYEWTPLGFMFDGLVDAFEENLVLQKMNLEEQEDESCLITEVAIGGYSLLIYQSKGMEGLEYLESETFPGITITLPLLHQSSELSRFKELDEYNLFSQEESATSLLDDDYVNFYMDLGSDTRQAAILVSKIFVNCFGVSKNDTVELTTDDFGQPATSPSTINTESIQKDAFTMKPAADANKPIKIQKKKKSKFTIFLWLLLGAIIYLYFSGQ